MAAELYRTLCDLRSRLNEVSFRHAFAGPLMIVSKALKPALCLDRRQT
jgi:hypothetical protein